MSTFMRRCCAPPGLRPRRGLRAPPGSRRWSALAIAIAPTALVENAARQANASSASASPARWRRSLRAGDVVISTESSRTTGRWRASASLSVASRRRWPTGSALSKGRCSVPCKSSRPDDKTPGLASKPARWPSISKATSSRAAAASAGIPFVVVRTIADSVHRELPPAALIPLAEDGTPDLARVLASVVRRPRQVAALCGLARETRTALAALVCARPRSARCSSRRPNRAIASARHGVRTRIRPGAAGRAGCPAPSARRSARRAA